MSKLEQVFNNYNIPFRNIELFGFNESTTVEEAEAVFEVIKQRSDAANDKIMISKQKIDTSKFN